MSCKCDIVEHKDVGSKLLLKLASATNWILKHDTTEISYSILLKSFATILDVSRAYMFKRDTTRNIYVLEEYWVSSQFDHLKCFRPSMLSCRKMKNFCRMIENRQSYYATISDVTGPEKQIMQDSAICSIACTPIITCTNEIWGFLGFDDHIKQRCWSDLECAALEAMSATLGTVIHKQSIEETERKQWEDATARIRVFRKQLDEAVIKSEEKLLRAF